MSTGVAPPAGRSILRSAVRGSVVYSIPLIAQRVAGIFLLSIVTRVLTTSDYGMLTLIEQVNVILTTFLGAHFASALGYFYFQKDSQEHRAQVTGTATIGAFAIGSVAALACCSLAGLLAHYVFGVGEARRYLLIAFLGMPFSFLVEAIFGWLRVTDRQGVFAWGSLLRLVLTVGGIGILVGVFKFHVIAYMVTASGTVFIASLVFVVYLLRTTRIGWSFALFGRMARFSLPLSLSWAAMFVINFGDQFVLRQYYSLAEVGIYALAYRISMLVNVAISAFYSYWNAQVYQILRREDAESVFARFFTYCVLMVSACSLVLTLGARPGLRILVAPAFRPAAALIPMLVAANAIRALSEFLRTRFLAAGRPRYETYCTWGGMAICVALYFLLIPRYGRNGAALATLLTFIAMAIASAIWTYRMKPYLLERDRLLKLGGVLAGIVIVYYAVPVSSFPAQVAWSALLLALFPIGLYGVGFVTPAELDAVRSVAGRLLRRRNPPPPAAEVAP